MRPRSAIAAASAALPASVALALVAGCLGTSDDLVLDIEATGTVLGLVYYDANGSRAFDAGDSALADVGVRLLPAGSRDTLVRATTDEDGFFGMTGVPVGSYDVAVAAATLGDSLELIEADPATLTVLRDDSVSTLIAASFRSVGITEARGLPAGTRVFVEGVALNTLDVFGDSSVHLLGDSAAIRVLGLADDVILAGDSLRVLGTVGAQSGQPVLEDAVVFLLDILEPPEPDSVSTATAAAAEAGALDAALVRIAGATIADTATVAGGFRTTVNDGSGALVVLFDEDIGFADLSPFVPGAVIDAIGVLVPDGAGAWILKPRGDADLTIP